MKLLDIAKKVGKSVVSQMVPGGDLLIELVNGYVDGKPLTNDATGDQLRGALAHVPPAIMARDFDVKFVELAAETQQIMLQTEMNSQHSTRPRIAWWSFVVVAIISLAVVFMLGYAVLIKDMKLVAAVAGASTLVLTIVGPFVALLYAYFGILKHEQRHKLSAALGEAPTSLLKGLLSRVIK
jgi:hypothetical protein